MRIIAYWILLCSIQLRGKSTAKVDSHRDANNPDRLGGITYARVKDGFEIPRPVMKEDIQQGKLKEELLKPKVEGQ